MKRNQDSFWKKFFDSNLFVVITAIVAVMIVFSYGRSYYQDYQIRQEISRLQANAEDLEGKKLELLEALRYVKSPAFVEEKARTELNLSKPGEKVVVVKSAITETGGQAETDVLQLDNVSNYQRWWRYFMDKKRS